MGILSSWVLCLFDKSSLFLWELLCFLAQKDILDSCIFPASALESVIFPKNPCFLLVKTVLRNWDLGASCAHWNWVLRPLAPLHGWDKAKEYVRIHTLTYILYLFIKNEATTPINPILIDFCPTHSDRELTPCAGGHHLPHKYVLLTPLDQWRSALSSPYCMVDRFPTLLGPT